MASPPRGDSDERGPQEPEGTAGTGEDAGSATDPEVPAGASIWQAPADDPLAEIAFYDAEASAWSALDPKRAAALVHEAAYLRERTAGLERDAAKGYASSLTLDPGYAPNAWALRQIFVRRGLWDNLIRVLDAEIRFAPWGRASDRADLQIERARLLEDRLGRDAEAMEGYQAALKTTAGHPGALWALLLLAWRTGDRTAAEAALGDLIQRTAEPGTRALFALELARLQRRTEGAAPDAEAVLRAAETLFHALPQGAEAAPLLRELDRLSLVSAADKGDLRLRFLDAFESRVVRDGPAGGNRSPRDLAAVVSNQREKARVLLRRGARDAALAVLERTLEVAPAHPLVHRDFLDAAEEAGRPDAIVAMFDGPLAAVPPEGQAEALLRRAEIAERAGALGEAIGALDRIPSTSVFAPLVALARMRVLARLQDADGLGRAFAQAADRLADGDLRQKREAAHLLVRAATAHQRAHDDGGAAEEQLRRALVLVPGYGPAATALAALLGRASRFSDLASFIETQAVGGVLPRPLREALVVFYRDILADGPEALRHQRALLAGNDDVRTHLRTVDAAGLAGSIWPEAVAVARASLTWLAERAPAGPARSALRLLAARLADGVDPAASEELLRQAFDDDPSSPAAAALEQLHRQRGPVRGPTETDVETGRQLAALDVELRRAEEGGRGETTRALRYRLAFVAAAAGRTTEAVAHLGPLRERGDRLAIAWSLDLARQGRDGKAEVELLGELGRGAVEAGDGSAGSSELTSAFERTRALGEALEQLGDRAGAARPYHEASTRAGDVEPALWADVELGVFRSHVAGGQTAEAVASLRRLALFVDGEAGAAVRREAALLALSAALPSDELPGSGSADGVWRWLRGVRSGDSAELVAGLEQIAAGGQRETTSAALWTAVAARRAFLGLGDASAALERATTALGGGPDGESSTLTSALAVVATDLLASAPLAAPLADLRRARATRLARGSASERRLAEALLVEEGVEAEGGARLSAAAAAYGEILSLNPESLEATEGLRRIAEITGDRRAQAATLVRRASLSRSRRRAAEGYAEAALLLQDEGADDDAGRLFLEVLARTPDDEEAYRRLHEIVSRRADHAGLEHLLSFKLQQTTDQAARMRLYVERARLRQGPRRDAVAAVQDWKRILQIEPHHPEGLRSLGELALEKGHFTYAARMLGQALAELDDGADPAVAANLRLQLAEAQEATGDLSAAIGTLTVAAEVRPDDLEPMERLVALAIRRRDHALALAHLTAMEKRAPDPVTRAAALVRIGRLERDGRHDQARALAAFGSALLSDPLGEGAAELVALVASGTALDDATRHAVDTVIADLRATLMTNDPLDVRRLERLRDLGRMRGLSDLAEVAGQLLGGLGMPIERGRARDLARPLTLAAMTALMAGDSHVPGLLAEVWPLLGEAAARLEGLDAAQLGATRQTRIPPGSERRLGWLEAATLAVGLPTLTVHVAGADDLAVVALDAPEPTLVVGRGVMGGDPATRFRVGRALFLLRHRAACVERLPGITVDEMVRAAAWVAGARPPGVDPAVLKSQIKSMGKVLGRRELRALESLRGRFEAEPLEVSTWRAAIVRGADRFGLLVSGDVAACLRVQAGGTDLRNADVRRPEILELVRFALDDRYGVLRRELGVVGGER